MRSVASFCAGAIALTAIANGNVRDTTNDYVTWIDFCAIHEHEIVTGQTVDARSKGEIRGLEIDDASVEKCARWGRDLTNLVCLRITSTLTNPLERLISAARSFPNLEYLHLQIRDAQSVGKSVILLTNLMNLRYLGIDAPSAAIVNPSIYRLTSLVELTLRVNQANIPDGIEHLTNLRYLRLFGSRSVDFGKLPIDLQISKVKHLELMNIPNIMQRLPRLPRDLLALTAVGCKMNDVPDSWLQCKSLESIDLNANQITRFPVNLLSLPSLRFIGLDLNKITNVPRLNIQASQKLKITLIANPIQQFAPENNLLVERGVIEK